MTNPIPTPPAIRRITSHLLPVIGGKVTGGVLVGGLIALTGFGPEEWFARAFKAVHLPEQFSLPGGIDLRIALVAVGVFVIVADNLLRRRSKHEPVLVDAVSNASAPAPTRQVQQPPPRLSIIVLPFTNLSDDREQEWFADAVADDLTTELSRITGSFVIGRGTAFTFKGKQIDPKTIGVEVGVRYALTGGVRRLQDDVRINVQLIDTSTGNQLWGDRFQGNRRDLALLQDRLVTEIARTLNRTLIEADVKWIARRGALKTDAQDHIALGWASYYRPRSEEALKAATQHFEQALKLEPQAVDAQTGLAVTIATMSFLGWLENPDTGMIRAKSLVRESLTKEPNNALVHFADGWIKKQEREIDPASESFKRALDINPNHPDSLRQLAECHFFAGRLELAIFKLKEFLTLSPRDPNIGVANFIIGSAELLLGLTDDAIVSLDHASRLNPEYWLTPVSLASAFALADRLPEAQKALAAAQALHPALTSLEYFKRFRSNRDARMLALSEPTLYVGLLKAGLPAKG